MSDIRTRLCSLLLQYRQTQSESMLRKIVALIEQMEMTEVETILGSSDFWGFGGRSGGSLPQFFPSPSVQNSSDKIRS